MSKCVAKKLVGREPSKRLVLIQTATVVCLLLVSNFKFCAASEKPSSSTAAVVSRGGWEIVQTKLEGVSLRVHLPADDRQPDRGFVICHGMNGTKSNDRFARLAQKLIEHHPDALIAQIDWSPLSKAECLGLPNPWRVSRRIPSVAEACHDVIAEWGLAPERWVFIGESFGNNVNARLSESLGSRSTMVAFNPASELGGGGRLDLQACSLRSFAFHTDSTYDTLRSVAHHDVFLVASVSSNDLEKHTYGVQWFVDQLEIAPLDVFDTLEQLPLTDSHFFTASVDASGRLVQVHRPRYSQEQGHGEEARSRTQTENTASSS